MGRRKTVAAAMPAVVIRSADASRGRHRRVMVWLAALVALFIAVALAAWWLPVRGDAEHNVHNATLSTAVTTSATGPDSLAGLLTYCAVCHTLPEPSLLSKDRWPQVLSNMNTLVKQQRLGVPLSNSQLEIITDYYVRRAPSGLPPLGPDGRPSPLLFSPAPFGSMLFQSADGGPPIIANLQIVDLNGDGRPEVLISDIGHRALTLARQSADGTWNEEPLASVAAPGRLRVLDFNGDGHLDILLADLGSIKPSDDQIGKIYLLLNNGRMEFNPLLLASHFPRMADVHAVDIDGDGDLDILIAAFGLYSTGQIGWLEQTEPGNFRYHTIHIRNGVSQLAPADLNGDGRIDFIALISQQHEEVVAFINQGGQTPTFEERLLHKAPHPMWGFATMELVDLDRDGDLDLVLTNGDALDIDYYPKPWHGVQWLENTGQLEFTHHKIANFYGAYALAVADLDGDGDHDIVVTSMMNHWNEPGRQSVIWLENDGSQRFTPRRLAHSPTSQVTVATGDLTGDGRPDIIAGGMYVTPGSHRVGRVTLWANQGTVQKMARDR